jgi:hypothetical protein
MPKYKVYVTISLGWGVELEADTAADAEYKAQNIVENDYNCYLLRNHKSITYRGVNEIVVDAHEVEE